MHTRYDINDVDVCHSYCVEELTSEEVAQKLGCSGTCVRKRLHKMNVMRSCTEARELSIKQGRAVVPSVTVERGATSAHWKGGRFQDKPGYIWLYRPEHPRAKGNYVQEHIAVWEETHGRLLPKGWVIHHLNGIRSDNRPSNLLAMSNTKHNKLIQTYQQKIRELEVENRQLKRVLEDNQMIFYVSEN